MTNSLNAAAVAPKEAAAVVILSGGQDSTTCLFEALQVFERVHALTIDYGQSHRVELHCAAEVVATARAHYPQQVLVHEVVTLPRGVLWSTSPLLDRGRSLEQHTIETVSKAEGVEQTFVPLRNLLFLALAANRAVAIGAPHILIGVSQEDYGGYPDCRGEFLERAEVLLDAALGSGGPVIQAPLLNMSKADTVRRALMLPGCYTTLAYTHTCYAGYGQPCHRCHACVLRARGFRVAGVPDPLIARLRERNLVSERVDEYGIEK